jgi:hypothetical protein
MSSNFNARGGKTRAARYLNTAYANIEDRRAAAEQQAVTPYVQMMQSLVQMQSTKPKKNYAMY